LSGVASRQRAVSQNLFVSRLPKPFTWIDQGLAHEQHISVVVPKSMRSTTLHLNRYARNTGKSSNPAAFLS
jgi:hypothetical protein